MKKLPDEYYSLLHEIQAVDFVLVELNLYLNTHPDDRAAIEQYNQYAYKSKLLKEKYAAEYGPLQGYGGSYSKDPFGWPESPWPWQV